jgi:hypothetical protein
MDSGQPPFNATLFQQEACLEELRAEYEDPDDAPVTGINACLEQFQVEDFEFENSTYIWTLLLKYGEAWPVQLRNQYVEMSEAHAGEVVDLTENRNDIPRHFNEILRQLAGVQATKLQCGNFAVNPYLRKAHLNLYKYSAEIQVTLSYVDAAGVRHEITGGQPGPEGGFDLADYYQDGPNERYEINYPYPGIWQLRSEDCDGLDAFYDPIVINPLGYQLNLPAVVQEYDEEPFYSPNQPYYLEYQIKDQEGEIIPQADHSQFAIDFTVEAVQPDGTTVDYSMEYHPGTQTFRSNEPIKVPLPGEYQINLSGSYWMHEGRPTEIGDSYTEVFDTRKEFFSHPGLAFNATPVTPFDFEILAPTSGEVLSPAHESIRQGWPLKVRPFLVSARFLDEQGEPLTDLAGILADPDGALLATVTTADGDVEELRLTPENGIYGGTVAGLGDEGEYTLRVDLQSGVDEDYRALRDATQVSFNREDTFFTRAGSYYRILLLLVGLVALLILRSMLIRTNKVRGELVFVDGDTELATFPLYNGKNWRYIGPDRLKQFPALMLRSMRVSNSRKPGGGKRRRSPNEAVFEGSDYVGTDGADGVRIRFVTSDGRKFSQDIAPELPTSYNSDTMAQLIYKLHS